MTAIAAADYAAPSRILTGAEKSAALLLAMGKPLAARLLKRFDQLELRQITRAAAHLGAISSEALDKLVEEFTECFTAGADLLGNASEAEQLLTGALPPEEAADILSDVLGSSNSSLWERLAGAPEAALAAYIEKEHPQTAAFILSKVSPASAAKVVAQLPRDLRNDLLIRMIAPAEVSNEALRIVEAALQEDLLKSAARAAGTDSRARIADIVNRLDPNAVEDVIQTISEAQRGTETAFRDTVLSSMALRARRLVESELANGASVSQRDIAKARRAIAEIVLGMAQRGEIEIGASEGEEAA